MHKSQSENKAMLWQYHDLESILSEKITKLGQVINQNTTGVKFSYEDVTPEYHLKELKEMSTPEVMIQWHFPRQQWQPNTCRWINLKFYVPLMS